MPRWLPPNPPLLLHRCCTTAATPAVTAAPLTPQCTTLPAGQLPPPLPIFRGCQVFANHQYKVLYVRHAKTASSSLLRHFEGSLSSGVNTAEQPATTFEHLQASGALLPRNRWLPTNNLQAPRPACVARLDI